MPNLQSNFITSMYLEGSMCIYGTQRHTQQCGDSKRERGGAGEGGQSGDTWGWKETLLRAMRQCTDDVSLSLHLKPT